MNLFTGQKLNKRASQRLFTGVQLWGFFGKRYFFGYIKDIKLDKDGEPL